MVRIENPGEYIFIRFRKSNTKNKKYDAILKNRKTSRYKVVSFGDKRYKQFFDNTGIGAYSHLDHLDEKRRANYKKRNEKNAQYKFSSSWFSHNYLW